MRETGFNIWVGKIPWRRKWQPTPLFLPGESHEQSSLALERARSETEEALSALRRLQRRVSELEEESRLQDADLSGASLQLELAHSLDSDQYQNQNTDRSGGALVSELSAHQAPHSPSGRAADSAPPFLSLEGLTLP